ncbi:hypothetical protein RhiJN_23908 [Ceratobasidium sp. AG-Ba]|nr:hypothetical protein RhiJN_23908 [Ceratobasidium sp. AG-Ba]
MVFYQYEDKKACINSLKQKECKFNTQDAQENVQKHCINASSIDNHEDDESVMGYKDLVNMEPNGIPFDLEGFFAKLSQCLIKELNKDTVATADLEGPLPEGN